MHTAGEVWAAAMAAVGKAMHPNAVGTDSTVLSIPGSWAAVLSRIVGSSGACTHLQERYESHWVPARTIAPPVWFTNVAGAGLDGTSTEDEKKTSCRFPLDTPAQDKQPQKETW